MNPNLNETIAQFIFEKAGSMSQPKARRNQTIQTIQNYLSACDKERFIQSVENLFKEYPQLTSFELDGSHESDDEGGSYLSVYSSNFKFSADSEHEEDEVSESIYESLDHSLLGDDLIATLFGFAMRRDNLSQVRQKIFEKSELQIFEAVENYEKNLLEKTIPLSVDSNIKRKI